MKFSKMMWKLGWILTVAYATKIVCAMRREWVIRFFPNKPKKKVNKNRCMYVQNDGCRSAPKEAKWLVGMTMTRLDRSERMWIYVSWTEIFFLEHNVVSCFFFLKKIQLFRYSIIETTKPTLLSILSIISAQFKIIN